MKKLVREITAYRYGELEEYAREKARENYLAEEHLPEFFSDDLTAELQEQYGLNHLKTYYSLSYCQGDGLCLYGRINHSELFGNGKFKKVAFEGIHYRQIQSVYDVLQGIDFEHCNRYFNAKTVCIDSHFYDDATDRQMEIIERIAANIQSWYFSFCREWEKRGYDYFYKISDEEMREICEINDYFFAKGGQSINMDEYSESAV
ncbi:hypothetical protein FACS189451_00100 [Bacteroidia bacterium]|nr:hypothetical protein FACS189446_5710 [Bacteroidia bacterium]GHT60310.1 hypothetical protein FACS189451_00100 [Bacteroidia bacterium]